MTQNVTQDGMKPGRARMLLTARAGMGLVMFHLGRLGHEFAVTYERSPAGDIWTQVNGRKVGIEVKATLNGAEWHVTKRQVSAADFYCLVQVRTAACYILSAAAMFDIIRERKETYPGVVIVSERLLPSSSYQAWSALSSSNGGETPSAVKGGLVLRGKTKIVRKVLADGTVKTYTYEGRQILPRTAARRAVAILVQ